MRVKSSIYNTYSRASQASKSTSSKKTIRKRDISFGLPYSEFPAATGTFTGLAVSALICVLGCTNSFASSINITLTGNPELNLVKSNTEPVFGTTASTPQTATITSDHFTGYTLTIAGQDDIGSLKGANDNTKTIPSIQTAISENTFRNDTQYNDTWGFLPNKLRVSGTTITNENYQPAPKLAGTTIDVTTSPTSNEGNKYKLALGAKVTPTMSYDSYNGTFILAATGNYYNYHIGYTDSLSTIPADQYGEHVAEGAVTLSSTAPTKAGYTFKGWCSQPTINTEFSATCADGVKTYQPGDTVTLSDTSANNMELYAIWEPVTFAAAGATTMQSMTPAICNAVAIGQTATLRDTRDNTNYTVGKMADGRCWMLDNLALGRVQLTSSDTNISASSYTFPAEATNWVNSYDTAKINTNYINETPDNTLPDYGSKTWKVGVYYNYCAATAGTYCPAGDTAKDTPVTEDICPKGWRLPSGGPGGEFLALYTAYGRNYNNFRTSFRLPLSGNYSSAQVYNQGSGGRWWSSTFYNGNGMYNLYAHTSGIAPQNANDRFNGFSVRCIAK